MNESVIRNCFQCFYPECQKLVKPGVFPDYFILKQGLIEDEANLLVEPYKSTGNDRKDYQVNILPFLKDFCGEQHLFCYDDVLLENNLCLAVNKLEMDIKESGSI